MVGMGSRNRRRAKDLAGSLVNETEMIVIDDFPVASLEVPKQRAFRDAWPYATTCTLNKAWSDSFLTRFLAAAIGRRSSSARARSRRQLLRLRCASVPEGRRV